MAEIKYNVLQKPLVERLVDAACIYWEVSEHFFRIKNRDADTEKRHIMYFLLYTDVNMGHSEIAKKFGMVKSTVFEAVNKIDVLKNIDPNVSRTLTNIRAIATNLEATLVTMDVKLHLKND